MSPNPYLSPQEREIVENARVGIAGAGGLGSNCALFLVRAGVRRLAVADFDIVSPSNLNRQFYFPSQIGMPKTAALAENLRLVSPGVEIDLFDGRLDRESMPRFFEGCDAAVEAFDSAQSKLDFLSVMPRRGVPLVAASGIAGWGASNSMRVAKAGRGLYIVGDCSSEASASLPPQAPRVAIAAAMQANTVLALLLGREP